MQEIYISLPIQVLIGAIAGILAGIFFGDYCHFLQPIGTAYTMLLEVVVYPYLLSTLISALGKLTPQIAVNLFKRGWLIYVFLVTLSFVVIIALAATIPSFSSVLGATSNLNEAPPLIDLLIPHNIFSSLANNYVPAVTIFSVIFGIMLQTINKKQSLIEMLDVISATCLRFWKWLVKFAPLASFTLLAVTFGTVKFSHLLAMGEYILVFFAGSFLLTFWILPICITAFVPIKYKDLMLELRNALVIAVATTLSVVAIPYIYEATQKIIQKTKNQNEEGDIIKSTLLVSYSFAQIGNFFLCIFMLFAALYFYHPVTTLQKFFLPIAAFFSSFGSPSAAVNAVSFLGHWLSLPPETTELYVSMTPLSRYAQVLVSVMGFAFMTLLITQSYYGHSKWQFKKLFIHLSLLLIILVGSVIFIRSSLPDPSVRIYQALNTATLNSDIRDNIQVTMAPPFDEHNIIPAPLQEDSLARIQRTGVLRVGYNPDVKPFVYFNDQDQLVGFDVAYMYKLAKNLNARIEFIPYNWQYLVADILADKFDIAIGGIYVTEERLKQVAISTPYNQSAPSFIIPEQLKNQFKDAAQIRALKNLKIGVFASPVIVPLLQSAFPNANLITLPDFTSNGLARVFVNHQADAVFWSQNQTEIWALGHPGYVSITPKNIAPPFLMGFVLNPHSPQFLHYLNYWLVLQTTNGFQQQQYKNWLLAWPEKKKEPRWSVIRNILHWVR